MIVNGTVYGIIDVQSKKINAFSEEDVRLVEIIAAHTETAISNIERQTLLEKQYKQLLSLMGFSTDIIGISDIRVRLHKVVEVIYNLGWRRVVLSLRDKNLEIRSPEDIITAGLSEEERKFLWEHRIPGTLWKERFGPIFDRYKIGQFYYIAYNDKFVYGHFR